MDGFKNAQGSAVVPNLIRTIRGNREYLSGIDGAIGDGDHGINMNKGFSLCQSRLKGGEDLQKSLYTLGNVLLTEIGGTMGPLYGMFFLEMSKACNEKENIDKHIFKNMLDGALTAVGRLGDAKAGDKTMMDALIPAVNAFNDAILNNKSFSEALEDLKKASKSGMESTRDLIAKTGRASRLGERSRGVLDAGAVSCDLILQSMADTIKELIVSERRSQ